MSKPISVPAARPQPNESYFGVEELHLFKTFTRESYKSAFGVDAPPYDPARVVKSWFDSTVDTSDPASVVTYKIVAKDQSGTWGIRQMMLPANEAATVNLTGGISYSPYIVTPTQATRGGSGINAMFLTLETEARTLMAEIGGTSIVDEGIAPVFSIVYPLDELRRAWDVMFHGQPLNAGLLLAAKNAKGVGAPGRWDTSAGDAVWIADPPAPTGLTDTRPPRELPVRDLLPNEALQSGLMGVGVSRADLEQPNGFTADDRALLKQIYQLVSRT